MDTVRICLFAVAGVTLAILLRQWRGEFVPLLRFALAAVFAGAIIAMSAPLVSYIRTLTEAAGVPGYARNSAAKAERAEWQTEWNWRERWKFCFWRSR